jgi:hypothetical protein
MGFGEGRQEPRLIGAILKANSKADRLDLNDFEKSKLPGPIGGVIGMETAKLRQTAITTLLGLLTVVLILFVFAGCSSFKSSRRVNLCIPSEPSGHN